MSTVIASRSSRQSENLKKRDHITYDKSWNLRLSHLMGVYGRYFDSTEQWRALNLVNAAITFIQHDRQNRLHYNKEKEELDHDAMMDFDELADKFKRLLGTVSIDHAEAEQRGKGIWKRMKDLLKSQAMWTEQSFREYQALQAELEQIEQEHKFSYVEIRANKLPTPEEDKVYIGREVSILRAWGTRPAAYVAFRIGFVYEVMVPKLLSGGMVITVPEKIPMLDWSDPKTVKTKTNCVPYAYWVKERMLLMNELMPVLFELETIIAQYLHNEGFNDFTARKRQPVNTDSEYTEQQPVDERDKYNK